MTGRAYIGVLVGVIIGLLWHYFNAEIVGYLAISRFPDYWPLPIRIAIPLLIFLLAVILTYWLVFLIRKQALRIVIWASFLTYVAVMVYAHAGTSSTSLELLLSALFACTAIVCGLVALRIARGKRRER